MGRDRFGLLAPRAGDRLRYPRHQVRLDAGGYEITEQGRVAHMIPVL